MSAMRRASFLAVAGAAAAACALPAKASTFDPLLYGTWTTSKTTTTGKGKNRVSQTMTVILTFNANNNLYYQKITNVNGHDTEKSLVSGVYQIPARGFIRVSFDPTLGADPLEWQYAIAGTKLVVVDETGTPQNFVKSRT